MTSRRFIQFAFVAALLLSGSLTGAALAQERPNVVLAVDVEREDVLVDDRGRAVVERQPVRRANPGDLLVYTLTAANQGTASAVNARIEDPVPQGTVLVLDGFDGSPTPTEASVDGGQTWQQFPVEIDMTDADGNARRAMAPGRSYTHLRWVLDGELTPGESRELKFKVRVN